MYFFTHLLGIINHWTLFNNREIFLHHQQKVHIQLVVCLHWGFSQNREIPESPHSQSNHIFQFVLLSNQRIGVCFQEYYADL